MTAQEVDELIKPTSVTFEVVHDWLFSHGINIDTLSYSSAKDWVELSLPVSAVENLLNTEYSIFQHKDGDYVIRAPEWSLPTHLHAHIDTVQPTDSFFRPSAMRTMFKEVMPAGESLLASDFSKLPAYVLPAKDIPVSQACNASLVTPLCLRTLYGTIDYTPKVPGKNRVGLTDYLGESNNRSDISLFLQQFRPEAAPAAYQFKFDVIAGGSDQQSPDNATQLDDGTDLEGNLDAETILGIDYPTPLTAYTTGGSPPFIPDSGETTNSNEPYLVWARYVLAQSDDVIPQVSVFHSQARSDPDFSYGVSTISHILFITGIIQNSLSITCQSHVHRPVTCSNTSRGTTLKIFAHPPCSSSNPVFY